MILRLQMQNCTAYATYHILHQQMKGTKWHKATNAKNGFVESAERYLVSHLKTYEKNGIVLFAVTDINSKNVKYILPLTLSCPLVTKGHTTLEQSCSFYLLLPLGMNGINGIIFQESDGRCFW